MKFSLEMSKWISKVTTKLCILYLHFTELHGRRLRKILWFCYASSKYYPSIWSSINWSHQTKTERLWYSDVAMNSRNVSEIFKLSNTLQTINNNRGSIMLGRGDFFFLLSMERAAWLEWMRSEKRRGTVVTTSH